MTWITSRAVVLITRHFTVVVVSIRVCMAIEAIKYCIVIRVRMTLRALIPLAFMLSTINREVHPVVIECGWDPFALSMTRNAVCRKLSWLMIWIRGGVIIRLMTSKTCVWSIVIIPVVTSCTIACDWGMCTIQRVIIVVDIECGRIPFWIGRMAWGAIGG
jgi:hypothetical protein